MCVGVCFNVGDGIFYLSKGASEDTDCFHLVVYQVPGVKVAGYDIGLELLTPIEVGTRCETWSEEPAVQFSLTNVAIPFPNLCSIVSLTDADTWVGVFLTYPVPESSTGGSQCVRSARCLFTRKFIERAISCNATQVLSVITYPLSSAGRGPTIGGRVFLRFPLSGSILWGCTAGCLRRMEILKLLTNI